VSVLKRGIPTESAIKFDQQQLGNGDEIGKILLTGNEWRVTGLSIICYRNRSPWMTFNYGIPVILRSTTEFGSYGGQLCKKLKILLSVHSVSLSGQHPWRCWTNLESHEYRTEILKIQSRLSKRKPCTDTIL